MLENKVVKFFIVVLYYFAVVLCWLELPYLNIIDLYFPSFFLMFRIILPFLLLTIPIVFKFFIKKKRYSSIWYGVFSLLLYIQLSFFTGALIKYNFRTFSSKKWNNENFCGLRYLMLDDLYNKYSFIGTKRDNAYEILGSPKNANCPQDYEEENNICYYVNGNFSDKKFFCLYFDANDIVVSVE